MCQKEGVRDRQRQTGREKVSEIEMDGWMDDLSEKHKEGLFSLQKNWP